MWPSTFPRRACLRSCIFTGLATTEGAPTHTMLDSARRWQNGPNIFPQLTFGTAQSFFDLLNASKYGYDAKGNVIRLSLLRYFPPRLTRTLTRASTNLPMPFIRTQATGKPQKLSGAASNSTSH